ncbi:MAG: hypothetical protein VSS75_009605 [Candidatus Parabeggiatoa sp.]|nr:hypothetical protein [Thiotrichaceae bacterium]MEC4580599.1 hypothetical protein [Candidatus Parabeggiatoa sp.]
MFEAEMSLNLGDVFYRWVNFESEPHNKYFILVAKKPKRFFFINSSIPPFILRNPQLTAQQVEVPSTSHSFLSHDSYANCVMTVDTSEIRNVKDFNLIPENDKCGCVTLNVLEAIYEAVRVNETLDEEVREKIEIQLKSEIDTRKP